MKTNFFTELEKTTIQELDFSIRYINDNCTIIIKANPIKAKDDATKNLKPIIISTTSTMLDEKFFETVKEQLQKTQTFFSNIETIETDREEKLKQTQHKKAEKEKYDKNFKALQDLTESEDFDPKDIEQKNKALKIVTEILKIKDKCPKTLAIKNEIITKASEVELF